MGGILKKVCCTKFVKNKNILLEKVVRKLGVGEQFTPFICRTNNLFLLEDILSNLTGS